MAAMAGASGATSADAATALGIVVLGMGRSGTSAIAGMLVRAGFFAGREDDVLPADADNERGHHENLGVLNQNEEVILGLGGYWYLPPDPEAQLAEASRVQPLLRTQLQRLAEAAEGRPVVVKDPRIGVMMPLWQTVIEDCLYPVLVTRHPLDVARSLQRREGTPTPNGLAIWETYMSFMLGYLQDWTVTVLPYDDMLANPESAVPLIAELAGHIDPTRASHVVPADAPTALEASLRHNRHEQSEVEALMTTRQQQLWDVLSALTPGERTIDVPPHLRQPTASGRSIVGDELYRLGVEDERRRSAARDAELARATDREQELRTELSALEERYRLVVSSRRWRLSCSAARAIQAARTWNPLSRRARQQ